MDSEEVKNGYVLDKIFSRTALKILEYFLILEEQQRTGEIEDEKYITPNLSRLAERSGVSKSALKRAIDTLEEEGFIICRYRPRQGGSVARVIQIDWENQLVEVLMKGFRALLRYKGRINGKEGEKHQSQEEITVST